MIRRNIAAYSSGTAYPTVSGRLIVVAPARTARPTASQRKLISVRLASSAENSTSAQRSRAYFTLLEMASSASSRVKRSLLQVQIGVAKKRVQPGMIAAPERAVERRVQYRRAGRAPAPPPCSRESRGHTAARVPSRSPRGGDGEAALDDIHAERFKLPRQADFFRHRHGKAGRRSPSPGVRQKMRTVSMALSRSGYSTPERQADQIYNNCELYKAELYQQSVNAAVPRRIHRWTQINTDKSGGDQNRDPLGTAWESTCFASLLR